MKPMWITPFACALAARSGVRRSAGVGATFAAAILCGASAAGWAQRDGDVSGGMDNQPTRGEVETRERAAGVVPPPAERRREAETVDRLYRRLMDGERAGRGTAAPAGPDAPPTDAR